MIVSPPPPAKAPEHLDRCAAPPWDRAAPAWLALDAQLPPDHLARLIDLGVAQLDLTPLFCSYSGRGSPACRPDLLLKMVLFEIQRGRPRPAQWHLDAQENIALQWLGLGLRPARSVWYVFASRLAPYLDAWNQEVLRLAQTHHWTEARRAALDGTFVEAHASRHHLLNTEQLSQRQQVLQAAVAADAAGEEPAEPPYWLARTAATRFRQQQQYRTAQAHLDEQLAENQQRIPSLRREEKDIRLSVTDPEAALGKDKFKVYRPLYNVQYVRDLDSPLVLGYDTYATNSDAGMLVPLLRRTEQLTGRRPETLLADSGFVTGLDLADAQREKVDLYGPWKENDYTQAPTPGTKPLGKEQFVWDESKREYRCPQGQPLKLKGVQNRPRSRQRTERLELYRATPATCAACPLKPRCCPKSQSGRHLSRSEHEQLIESHREKMETPEAKQLYKQRRQTVEPSFGDTKQHRNYRRVSGRGLEKAKCQTGLTVLCHNLWHFVKWLVGAGAHQPTT
jgi:transposase